MPDNHVLLPPDQLKNKKFCKFHNATSHSTNECRVFQQHIQRAIQQGRLKFDTPQKMKINDNPFLRDQNMVDARLLKGKTKVLISTSSKEIAIVDPVYWELEDFKCFFGKLWEGGFIKISNEGQQPI